MHVRDRKRYDDLIEQEDRCRQNAKEAIAIGSSVGAREWMDAADACRRLANHIKYAEATARSDRRSPGDSLGMPVQC